MTDNSRTLRHEPALDQRLPQFVLLQYPDAEDVIVELGVET